MQPNNTMEDKTITGATEDEIWQQLSQDLTREPDLLQYRASLTQGTQTVLFDIDIDLGGGFESGFATTIFSARFINPSGYCFAIYPQHFTDAIGKAFGMQDVIIGHAEFDEKLIVKTNDEVRTRVIFKDPELRNTLISLPNFTYEITLPEADPAQEESTLELVIEEGITDPATLRSIYHTFMLTLEALARY